MVETICADHPGCRVTAQPLALHGTTLVAPPDVVSVQSVSTIRACNVAVACAPDAQPTKAAAARPPRNKAVRIVFMCSSRIALRGAANAAPTPR
jgi:hypothetical protein